MRIESTCSSAVPVRVMLHEVRPGAVALPAALQVRLIGLVSEPWAVPVRLRSPAHFAVNFPFAVVGVCSVTSHWKSEHALGDGIRLDEVQLPENAFVPAASGPVSELFRSKPTQPVASIADRVRTAARIPFFMFFISARKSAVDSGGILYVFRIVGGRGRSIPAVKCLFH